MRACVRVSLSLFAQSCAAQEEKEQAHADARPPGGASCAAAPREAEAEGPAQAGVEPASTTEPEMERDSAESEEGNYDQLLASCQTGSWEHARFSLSVNNQLLRGWVKQPSPCCAAAALAGACNALRGLHRSAEHALSHEHALDIMANMLAEQAEKLRQSAERCLGAPLLPLRELVVQRLCQEQLRLDMKLCTRRVLLRVIREVSPSVYVCLCIHT